MEYTTRKEAAKQLSVGNFHGFCTECRRPMLIDNIDKKGIVVRVCDTCNHTLTCPAEEVLHEAAN